MFTVTRQTQFPDGTELVEVSAGGIDYCNPDALVAKYAGEFEEFSDPREAVKAAIDIARQWRKDTGRRIPVGVGCTMGMTLPFSPDTQKHAIAWARKTWDALEKCPGCSEPMPDSKREYWHANEWDGLEYCSERCATRAAEFEAEEQARIDAEEDAEGEEVSQ